MRKKKILLQTNSPFLLTGLGENGKELMKYFLSKCRDKYDFVYYCTQLSVADQSLANMPCKAYGSIPNDQNIVNQLNQNPGLARDVAYGSYYIDEIIKNEKPDIYIGSDDAWAFGKENYINKKWWNKLNNILHITIDSVPVLEQAFEQAKTTKNFITWAKFAQEEMKKYGPEYQHINQIYGTSNIDDFQPISKEEKLQWRKRFGIDEKTVLFSYLSRNQLRKIFPKVIEAFALYKKKFPLHNVKLHFHTSFSEKGMGWDIPKLMNFYGVKNEDVLCTYVCKKCGQWHVAPYSGEDINCPYCGEKKSMITANIVNGVPADEMKYLYGISDASINAFTSGGLERSVVNSLLCGLPTACTNYSSGEDFCKEKFVYSLENDFYYEAGTNFRKATTKLDSIISFINKIYNISEKEKSEISKMSRDWAVKTFSIDTIGKQWEELFDSLPYVDWTDFSFEQDQKNQNFKLPENYKSLSDNDFITLLYKNVLNMDEPEDGSGRKSWLEQIKSGVAREAIYSYFIKTAQQENDKNKKIDFRELLDNNGKKRALFIMRRSIGDIIISTSLLESFHEQYPNTDLYFACEKQYFNLLEGNPYVHKVIEYQSFMENEMICIGAGQKNEDAFFDYFFHPGILSQNQLQYLSAK